MNTVRLVEFEGSTKCFWDFPENRVLGWGIINEDVFIVPNGFVVGTDLTGRKHFYDMRNNYNGVCELETSYKSNKDGTVAITCTSNWGERIKLKRVHDTMQDKKRSKNK